MAAVVRADRQDRLELDPAVFHSAGDSVWLAGCDDGADRVDLDEGFMLLGPESDDFAPWLRNLLPRYLAAHASGALPRVPVLINRDMPARQHQALRLLLPAGTDIVPLPGRGHCPGAPPVVRRGSAAGCTLR